MDSYHTNNTHYGGKDFIKGVGRMFYIISPGDNVFNDPEKVPNFYVQSWPYFLTFIVLEHIILKIEGKRGLRLNDGITSISNGLFLESGRLIWRGAESYIYMWIHTNYRLVDLPWDSNTTWFLAALSIDFCYYWMHRACHEIHILWAQHQVHHTSEDFNMAVGIRQSIFQGWCGFIFYLPLALAIPPAQFVMHHQFSYIYMFWIHTESIKSLGYLEYLFNTPSHHRIHHGSNPFCIDVNYGGVLIIWDKLFGTFRPEKNGDHIVYGLIYNQPSFNPLHLQTFYSIYITQKWNSYTEWQHKLRAIFDRPSWKPNTYVRFKDMPEDPTIHTRIKYDVILPKWCATYLLIHYCIILYGFYQLFLIHSTMLPMSTIVPASFILGSLAVFGIILDASSKAPLYEFIRCMLAVILSPSLASTGLDNFYIKVVYVISGIFWCLCVNQSVKINAIKQGE